jgi:Flp pilus assembly protein TadD
MKKVLALLAIAAWLAMASGHVFADMPMGKAAPPLTVAAGSKAEQHNKEGIEHYNQGHWDVALKHFTAAVKEDANSAEAHYNVALALDKSGDHKAATEHFRKAFELGKNNPDIQNSGILKGHLKM